jgi:iron complex transport system substrate-binding protein
VDRPPPRTLREKEWVEAAPPSRECAGLRFFSQPGALRAGDSIGMATRSSLTRRVLVLACFLLLGAAPGLLLGREVVDQTGRSVNIPDRPSRLISLAPSITETLFALGLGNEVVGDTDYCDFPSEAREKPHVGSILNPNLERIVAFHPDLVLGSPGANRRETADQLERLGIAVYGVNAQSVEETLHSIQDLGRVLGREREAEALVESLRRRIAAVEQRAATRRHPKVLFVVWYRPLTTAGQHSFIDDVIRRAGGVPINHGLPGEWPRMSLEEALHRDPDVILFPQSAAFSPSLDELSRLPGWRDLRAVKTHQLYFIPETIIRPSPRLIDALEEVAGILDSNVAGHSEVAH